MSKSQRACDFCRSRKSACRIEASPPCRLCRSHRRVCTFDEPAPKRGARRSSQPVGTFSQAEALAEAPSTVTQAASGEDYSQWIASIDEDAGFAPIEDLGDPGLGDELDGMLRLDEVFPVTTAGESVDRSPQNADSLPEASPGTFLDLARVLTGDVPCGLADARAPNQLCGITGDMDPYLLSQYRYDPSTHSMVFKKLAVRAVCGGLHPIQFLVQLPTCANDVSTQFEAQRALLNSIVTPDVGQRLIDLYYRFVYPQIPIFSATARPNALESPPHVLAAMYLVANAFSSFDDVLCIQTVYEEPPSDRLVKIVTDEIGNSAKAPTIGHLQSTLLLILAPPENPVLPENCGRWSLVGTAVTMAQSLGLYHEPQGWVLCVEEINLRRRLSWVVRYVDVWLAATLGRVPLISRSNWLLEPIKSSEFSHDEAEQTAAHIFAPLVELTLILGNVLEALFSLESVQTQTLDFRLTLRTARPLMRELSHWYAELEVLGGEPNADTDVAPSGVLHLGYHVVKLWILRAAIRPFHCMRQSAAPMLSDEDTASAWEAWSHLRVAAERAVAAFTAFTAGLDSSQLHAFWPFWSGLAWSSVGQMCTTLLLIASDKAEAERGKRAIDRVRRVMRLQSKSLAILRFPLLRLDSMHWKGFDTCFHLSPQVREVLYPDLN